MLAPRSLLLSLVVVLDLVVLTSVGLFTDPSTVSLMARGAVDQLADQGVDLGSAGQRIGEVVVYALVLAPIGTTLALSRVPVRRALWAIAAGTAALVVAVGVLSGWLPRSTEAWSAVLGAALGLPLGAGLVSYVGGRRQAVAVSTGPVSAVGRAGVAGVVVLTIAVMASVTFVRLVSPFVTDDAPLATTPVDEAREVAKSKDLIVGMAYGGRLQYMDRDEIDQSLDEAVALGADWVRTDLEWGVVQADGPDSYDWSGFDQVVASVNERGLELLPILLAAPEWARRDSCREEWACPPESAEDFVDFARAAAERYSGQGVDTWEIWNEQNITAFWIEPDADFYAEMLIDSAAAIREVDPDAEIVMGGTAALEPNDRIIEARAYLDRVCDLGACDVVDAVAYHPYTFPYQPSDPGSDNSSWRRMSETEISFRSILESHGRPNLPIWLTEYGAPTGGPGIASDVNGDGGQPGVTHVTERRQAEIAYDSVLTSVVDPDVEALFWYTDVDLPEVSGKNGHFGLRRADGTKKPAWSELRRAIAIAQRSD